MIVLFGVFVRFGAEADAHWEEEKREMNLTSDMENDFYFRYPCEYSGRLILVLAAPHPIHPIPTRSIPSILSCAVAEPVRGADSSNC